MIRSALILLASLLGIAFFSCVAGAQCQQGLAFASTVYTLSYSYDPSNHNIQTYKAPRGVVPVPAPYSTSLAYAYCIASPSFQRQLSALTGVFITCQQPQTCSSSSENKFANSWGFHENKNDQSPNNGTYVALSAALCGNDNTVPDYGQFEYNMLDNLLGGPGLNVSFTPIFSPSNYPISIYSQSMTILAALAHEIGHIYWWYPYPGIPYYNCGGGGYFSDISWNNHVPTPKFHKFGQQQHWNFGNNGNIPRGYLDKDTVLQDLAYGRRYAYSDLASIYDGDWASLFATVAPDEDFVETYKLWTLNKMGLNSLQVTIDGYPVVDMIVFLTQVGYGVYSGLYDKAQWIQQCLAFPK